MKSCHEYSGVTSSLKSCRVSVTLHQFSESLGNAIDAKDPYTCTHSEEVAVVSQAIGVKMGLSNERCELLHIAGHLHDIGKIGVADSILKKEGKLTDEEFRIIQCHPEVGASIVAPVTAFSGMDIIGRSILHHHERYDGKGYPYGLKGEGIPLEARIIAVADTISAMASNRPYRKALPFETIVDEVQCCSGTQFDPVVVDVFMRLSGTIESYYAKNSISVAATGVNKDFSCCR